MLTLDVVKSCHMVAGDGILSLEVWSKEGVSLLVHRLPLTDEIKYMSSYGIWGGCKQTRN